MPIIEPESEQRSHRRSLCSELVEVSFEDQTGRRISQTTILEDLSPGGACVSSAAPLAAGSRVRLKADGFESEALVRHCEIGHDGYLLGLEFAAGQSWDRLQWNPQHLYTPGEG